MKSIRLVGIVLVLAFSASVRTEAQSIAKDDDLRKWIEGDLHFFPSEVGMPKLFLRRQPVKVGIPSDPFPGRDEINRLIGSLSAAAGVSYEVTNRDVNLAIVVQSPINDGDKPEMGLWKRVGLSQKMYEIVSAEASWRSGCGIYSFSARGSDEVPLSIVFADSNLEPAQVRNCVIEGVIRAFGLRTHRTQILRADDGYLQYVALTKALNTCEKKIGIERLLVMSESDQRAAYADCAAEVLDKP